MYRILVVDDEVIICKSIKAIIERIGNPYVGEIYIAFDGVTAQEVFLNMHPHIVITDIRMPDISGLCLIQRLKSMDPDVSFIILSGYDDFQYAKEAIALGVVEYLLKPVITEELRNVLKKNIDAIRNQEKIKEELLRRNIQFELGTLQQYLDRVILNGRMDKKEVEEVLERHKAHFPYRFFCLGLIRCLDKELTTEERDYVSRILAELDESGVWGKDKRVYCLYNYRGEMLLLFNCCIKDVYPNLKYGLESLVKMLADGLCIHITASLSIAMEGIHNLAALYSQAIDTLDYRILLGNDRVIGYPDIKERELLSLHDSENIGKMEEYILSMRTDRIEEQIDCIFSSPGIRNSSIGYIKHLYEYIAKVVDKVLSDYKRPEADEVWREFSSFNNIEEIRSYLKEITNQAVMLLRTSQNEQSGMETAVRFIKDNYHRNINMALVANEVSMNYTYFSMQFKEFTGMNFSEYLTGIRMEKARNLLANPASRICDVALRVGYENANYFTRAFKSSFGVSPTEYQKT